MAPRRYLPVLIYFTIYVLKSPLRLTEVEQYALQIPEGFVQHTIMEGFPSWPLTYWIVLWKT